MKLIFATNNENKVAEVGNLIGGSVEVISLKDAGINKDIPEPYETLEENASTKSKTIFEITGENCFSEDTGLEVEALSGEPGVKSARYADGESQYVDIVEKLLDKMKNENNRKARFRTVISLIINNKEHLFEGKCEGKVATERFGHNGFGYDPVFIPDGSNKTFGEMAVDEKKKYSHRAKAIALLAEFIENQVMTNQLH